MMLSVISKRMGLLFYLLMIASVCSSVVSAADLPPHPEGDGEVPLLYNRLSQNIDMEAGHYTDYIDYRESLRLRDFWGELDRLNLNREEIIQTIVLLERKMVGRISGTYPLTSVPSYVTGPDRLSLIFSNWRPFYSFLSGGFLMIISSLFVFSYCSACRLYCPVCRQEVISFLHGEDRHHEDDSQRKAA
jgi:hypothetical protein